MSRLRKVEEFQGRQQRLEKFEQILEELRDVWRPRLEALAKKFGERVNVQPHVEPGRRSATFAFQSDLARIDLRFAVAPDPDVRQFDLQLRFGNHSHPDEIRFTR